MGALCWAVKGQTVGVLDQVTLRNEKGGWGQRGHRVEEDLEGRGAVASDWTSET